MQKLAEVCIKRPVFAVMMVLALVVVGATSYFRLGVDRFPPVDLPTISIRTGLAGASPEEIETTLSQPMEEALNTIEGISELRSVSGQGFSFVSLTFNLERDIESAAQDVRDRVASVLRTLPRDIDPPLIYKLNNDSSPVIVFALYGDRSIRELTEIADKVVKVQLERAEGVGEVRVVGGLERAINIWVDADRLAAYQLSINSVRNAVADQNTEVPGGNITGSLKEQTLRTMARLSDSKDFNDLVVAKINSTPIRVKDIGYAEDGTKEQRSFSRLNGLPSVTLEIRRQSGANTVEVIKAVKRNLNKVQGQIPSDIKLEVIKDQSRYIYAALHEINLHLILGSILASLVVLLFMRSWRSTVIAGIAIPASVITTFGMMWALDFTLNSVTMLALVLMVGIVIDDAIVVLENIFRFVEEKKRTPFDAAKEATKEIGLAVLATTLSLVVIFVPVSFMSSISGRFLFQFGITAAVAIMVSLFVSFSLTPMMSARLLRKEDLHESESQANSRRGFYRLIDSSYSWILALAMRHRLIVSLLAIIIIFTSVPLYRLVKQEYLPTDVDESEFDVLISGPEGMSLGATNQALQEIEKELRATPGVELILATAGGGFFSGVNQSFIYVRITPIEKRTFSLSRLWQATLQGKPGDAFRGNFSQREMMQEVRKRLKKFTDFRCGVRGGNAFNIGGGFFEIDFVLRGPDIVALASYAEQLRKKTQQLGCIVDADITLRLDKPETQIEIDRARAADLGVDLNDLSSALRIMVGGDQEVSRFHDPSVNEDYDVQLRLIESNRNDPSKVSRLFVPARDGKLIRLDNFVKLKTVKTASRIDRLDRQRQVSLRGATAPGYALADSLQALRDTVAEMNLPKGYTTTVVGRARELERTFNEFLWAFLLSVIFMYMILASQYESLVHPFTILLSLPLSVPFALLSLWATGNTLNLFSALGILVLFGVVKKNSILQIDHMNKLREGGMEKIAAIMQGNRDRLRPILMTTLALVAGMLPLAVGAGPGSEERRAIAIVVIGGQTLSLLLTLVVTPVVYSLLDDIGELLSKKKSKRVEVVEKTPEFNLIDSGEAVSVKAAGRRE